jgi:hypothetical protein
LFCRQGAAVGYHSVGISWFGAKDAFLKPFMQKRIFLSRQARDKYRESTQKEKLFVQISLLQVASATSLRGAEKTLFLFHFLV